MRMRELVFERGLDMINRATLIVGFWRNYKMWSPAAEVVREDADIDQFQDISVIGRLRRANL